MPDFRLPHDERLRSFGAVRRLFQDGHGGFVYPFRYLLFAEADTEPSVRLLFSVPKRYHKRANKRNLLKRRMREAYRLNKACVGNRPGPDLLDQRGGILCPPGEEHPQDPRQGGRKGVIEARHTIPFLI